MLVTAEDLISTEITVFEDQVAIDVQTRTPGLSFDDAWAHREVREYGGTQFLIVSKADLIASKRAAGRPIDLDDVRLLEEPLA